MASSASGQDEPNRALWLATWVGKMEPSSRLGTTRCIPQAKFPQKPYNKSFLDQVCSVKMAWYWPRTFFASLWTSTSSRSINTQKKELGQYPAILTWHLVNNPFILKNCHDQCYISVAADRHGKNQICYRFERPNTSQVMGVGYSSFSNKSSGFKGYFQQEPEELNLRIANGVFLIILFLTTLLGNSTILITIWKTSSLHWQNLTSPLACFWSLSM